MKRKQAPVARKLSDCQRLSQLIIIMAEADTAEKRSQDSGYEENENGEDLRSRSLKSYTSFDNSSLLSLELSDVSIFWKSLIIVFYLFSRCVCQLLAARRADGRAPIWRRKVLGERTEPSSPSSMSSPRERRTRRNDRRRRKGEN